MTLKQLNLVHCFNWIEDKLCARRWNEIRDYDICLGVTKNTFKQRYYGHSSSFRNREHEFSTTLSAHIWSLKDQEQDFDIRWQVIDRGREFNPTTRKCLLCIKEKYHIIHNPDGSSLNQRSELFSTCRHRTRNLLSNI